MSLHQGFAAPSAPAANIDCAADPAGASRAPGARPSHMLSRLSV